jgi:hypothetical protein
VGAAQRRQGTGSDVSAAEPVPGLGLVGHLTRLVLGPPVAPELSGAGWRALLNLAVRERCAALAWRRAGSLIAAHAPQETAAAWRQLYITIATRGHAQIAAAAEAADRLHREGVHPVTLKGFPLAAVLYGDATCRACTDIDWFVPREQRASAREALLQEGWSSISGGLPWDETFERTSPHGAMYIEVHSSLLHPRFSYLPVPEPEYEPMLVEGVAVRRQIGALLAPYLAAHMAQHAAVPLLWDVDFATLWGRMDAAEHGAAREAAARAGLSRYLEWGVRRSARVLALAGGSIAAARRLGFTDRGRRDVHPAWRHVRLAGGFGRTWRAIDGWVRPPWVRETYGSGIAGVMRRVVRHWRSAVVRRTRVGDRVPGDGGPVHTDIARVESHRLLAVARGVISEGGQMWIVATGRSMLPTIAPGDRVLIGPIASVQPGSVVLADAGGAPVLHRVVRVGGGQVVLRGDACQTEDSPIAPSDVCAGVRAVARGALVSPAAANGPRAVVAW